MTELSAGDVVLSLGTLTFTEPLTVVSVSEYVVKLAGGRFWPMPKADTLATVA